MAHFVKLGKGNIVLQGIVVHNDVATSEQAGIDFINNLYGTRDVWKQTSYNTRGGKHRLDGTPFRKNYAGIGWRYDQTRDAFIQPKPHDSWIFNEETCLYDPPVEMPELTTEEKDNGKFYRWNEQMVNWELV